MVSMKDAKICSDNMKKYFNALQQALKVQYELAEECRKKGYDPQTNVEIRLAEDLASRVEKLLNFDGVAEKIRELSKLYDREELSLMMAKEITKMELNSREDAIYKAIQVGLAILTEGVLVAPLEGVVGVKIKKNSDNSEYLSVYFAGPIRASGGTALALSVLIADVVRRELNLAKYIPTTAEVERYKEEIPLYKRVRHLQYLPSTEEIEIIVKNCPVCIDGEGTEEEEVSGYKNLPRIETNRVRGGACLVIAEGLCLKAPKIQKHVKKLKIDSWEFIDKFANKKSEVKENFEVSADEKYMEDVIAGRPVFSNPSAKGGFRLRYGRARNTGLAAVGIHPATMFLLEFLATGTQIKTERPGKAGAVVPCDSIDGPTVLLKNGDFVQINNSENAKTLKEKVKEIIDLGEILISFGEFNENNHILMKGSYSKENWILELKNSLRERGEDFKEEYLSLGEEDALLLSEKYGIPLCPDYNLFWHDISKDDFIYLRECVKNSVFKDGKLFLKKDEKAKKILIELGVLHKEEEGIAIEKYSYTLLRCFGIRLKDGKMILSEKSEEKCTSAIELASLFSGLKIKEKSPTRIGTRMARPEKASERTTSPAVHLLFPIGNAGGNRRLINDAIKTRVISNNGKHLHKEGTTNKISVEIGLRICEKCKAKTFLNKCNCGEHTKFLKTELKDIDLENLVSNALKKLNERLIEVKAVQGLISETKTAEPIEKGILRAKHGVYVWKDGTTGFDMTDVPLTHFKPKEINVSIEKLKELGYEKDYLGNDLTNEEQILELKVQDVVPSKKCLEYFLKVAKFIDELLVKFYGVLPYYKSEKTDDLIGKLIIGLSPHTSAGVLGRIIGSVDANVCYAHPFFHASKRRNCDGDEDRLMLLLDGLINFSREYLPSNRGGLMDAPLVLTTRIIPDEIDKEAQNIDCCFSYPKELYENNLKMPKDIENLIDNVRCRIGKEEQYEKIGFTHDTNDIANAPKDSIYKTLGSMPDKVNAQMGLAEKIRAVDENEVASKVIETHLLPDMFGNLKSFSTQNFRCTRCGKEYRRIPLAGNCKCGNKLVLTVHEASIKKYLEVAKHLSEKYKIPNYTRQRILLIEDAINSLFTSDNVKKLKIEDFV